MHTETILYLSILLAGLVLFYFIFFVSRKKSDYKLPSNKKTKNFFSLEKQKKTLPPAETSVKEIFDYGSIRIMHDNGIYTVNDHGRVMTYKSWRYLPVSYQKMVKQVDSGSLAKSRSGYFLDNINGVYYVTTPDGKKKKYASLQDIPEKIRNLI